MPTVRFVNDYKSLDVLPGTNLRKAALKSGIRLYNPLHRVFHFNLNLGPLMIPCASDVVEVFDGKGVNARTPDEERLISGRLLKRKVSPAHRLACMVQVNGDISVRTMPERELDIPETKRHLGYFAALALFILLMLVTFGIMALDLVKKL
ncbi:MAG: hypothetical protein HYW57_04240 [Ignavibacteriales bacterium]|nr:hypothetical protein [Ignavibacteriales bacterium]